MATKLRPARKRRIAAIPKNGLLTKEIAADLRAKASTRDAYGMFSGDDALQYTQTQLEAFAFLRNPPEGRGRLEHFRRFVGATWNGLDQSWNSWCDRMAGSLFRDTDIMRQGDKIVRVTTWTGCAAAGKTFMSALCAYVWWLVSPYNSIAILTSTTKEMLRRRAWSNIRNFTDNMVDVDSMTRLQIPHPIQESKTMIQATEGDDKHAIFALAVAHGETATAVAKMSGLHAERMLLIVDECDGTPDAIFRTIPNMVKGCRDFTFLAIANPKSHLDTHGRLCEPANGWSSVDVTHDTWRTRGVAEWQLPPGVCEHFDGHRSPNVDEGFTKYHHIYSYEDYKLSVADPERVKHIGYWAQDRGFWAGEGVASTIFTESMLQRYGGYNVVEWREDPIKLAFLDPAFGGDDCVLVFGECGIALDGKRVLQIVDRISLSVVGEKNEEIEYVIAKQLKEQCEARSVPPAHVGIDSNGTGRGCAAVAATEWSVDVVKLDSCGAVSDLPASADDPTPCCDLYDRAVTEHWFMARNLLQSGQLKGIYHAAAVQFCTREYERRGKKYRLSTKPECKATLGRSPDDADAIVGLCRMAHDVGGLYPRSTAKPSQQDTLRIHLVDPSDEQVAYGNAEALTGLYK